jgi:hypothetical protein
MVGFVGTRSRYCKTSRSPYAFGCGRFPILAREPTGPAKETLFLIRDAMGARGCLVRARIMTSRRTNTIGIP